MSNREHELKNIERTRAYYEVCASGFRWDAVAEMLTDDFYVDEATDLPIAGIYRGIDGLKALYEDIFFNKMNVKRWDIHTILASGEWIVSLINIYVLDEDGGELEMPVAESLLWRDGKLALMKAYWFDSNHFKRAMELKAKGIGAKA